MTSITTDRLVIRSASEDLAERIAARCPDAEDTWAPDFPGAEDVMSATMLLLLSQIDGEQHPFGLYTMERRQDMRTIGTIGFKGRPCEGSVEIGYSIVRSARGAGFGSEAVHALLALSRARGVERVVAMTLETNHASRRTLENAGLKQTGLVDGECRYEILLHP